MGTKEKRQIKTENTSENLEKNGKNERFTHKNRNKIERSKVVQLKETVKDHIFI